MTNEKAIKEIRHWIDGCPFEDTKEAFELAIKALENRPQGEWVISEIRCPECLEYFDTDCYSTEELKKCPCCGATMKGGT